MGFRYEPRQYNLKFNEAELQGLEVKVKSVSISKFSEMLGLTGTIFGGVELRQGSTVGDVLLGEFCDNLVEWNLEDKNDEVVKATIEACRQQDMWLIKRIVNEWVKAISGVSEELGKDSSSGKLSPEESLPMDQLSENPESSNSSDAS